MDSVAFWIPRSYGSSLGYLVHGEEVIERDVKQKQARERHPELSIGYDRDGMTRFKRILDLNGIAEVDSGAADEASARRESGVGSERPRLESSEVLIVADVNEPGYGFETPEGDGYGAPTLDETIILARNMGYVPVVER